MIRFSQFWTFSSKQIHKMQKITSYFYDMRKILTKNFWSQGTSPGSPGPISQKALGLGSCQFQILVIWGPDEPSVLVALHEQAKNLKTAGAWCDFHVNIFCWNIVHRFEFTGFPWYYYLAAVDASFYKYSFVCIVDTIALCIASTSAVNCAWVKFD